MRGLMNLENRKSPYTIYKGFEQGPIRPPSEAYSLLIRVTRNCPWNRCTFCPVYKNEHFSIRPVENIKRDIDAVYKYITLAQEIIGNSRHFPKAALSALAEKSDPDEYGAFEAAVRWMMGGMESIFIQDANSLVIKPDHLMDILRYLREKFPQVERITSYARSDTIARISDENLKSMADAGLNRIHIGLESGSDEVLKRVQKGVTKAIHITAGLKVKGAGIELSEYVMPGLGGKTLWETHARETADALNRINPDFIRLRTLAIPTHLELYKEYESGTFKKNTELETVKEILLFMESLEGINSKVKSDHILNLFQDIEGRLPEDKERMTGILKSFLDMDSRRQCVYQVGRRMGLFNGLSDMTIPDRLAAAESVCQRYGVTIENVDALIDEQTKRFI